MTAAHTSVPGISIAGDGAGIGGARAAEERGRLAALRRRARRSALDAARARSQQPHAGQALRRARARPRASSTRSTGRRRSSACPRATPSCAAARRSPPARSATPSRSAATGPNQMKAFLRCGMGPCQGRLCGLTVTELIADARGVSPEDVGYYRLRPPVKPITLGELAAAAADRARDEGGRARDDAARADVIVIGGGIHGCSTALHLALRGLKPSLIEKDYAGRHASGVNAGGVRQLARHLAEVPLSVASMEMWERIGDLVDDDCGFESHGQVLVAESEAELASCAPASTTCACAASRTRS